MKVREIYQSVGEITMQLLEVFPFQCIFDVVVIFMLLRMLDIKNTGGDIKEAFPCYEKQTTTPHTNSDVIDNEDDDVKAERERVKAVFDRNNIKVKY